MFVVDRGLLVALAGSGSVLSLAGALIFQEVVGLQPCQLCVWQRWPHIIAVSLTLTALLISRRPASSAAFGLLTAAGFVTMVVSAALGVWHSGIEQGWWQGLDSCSGGGLILETPMRCLITY